MIEIRNRIIPFKGYRAMCFLPFIFIRKGCVFNDVDRNHECIHGEQQAEMLFVGSILSINLWALDCGWWSLLGFGIYFWWYITEWFIRLFINRNAYRSISFEKEAYDNERNMNYLNDRKPFIWLRYLKG